MKKRVSIAILISLALLIYTGVLLWITVDRRGSLQDTETEHQADGQILSESEDTSEGREQTAQEPESASKETEVSVNAEPADAVKYVILPRDGNLVVYYSDYTTEYFDTGIEVMSLPDETIDQVVSGITFSGEEELFAFLESYSS